MGVSTTTNTEIYNGDGATQTFSFPFYFFKTTDLAVYLYDTVGGTVTKKTIGVDYAVTGTANSSGIYPNGGVVDFTGKYGAPASTLQVVITRAPPETQTFNLNYGDYIPSAPLVQQLDYITLLCQWLQDQVNRCVQAPVGFGPAFNPALPPNMHTAQAGSSLIPVVLADRSGWADATAWVTPGAVSGAAASAAAAAASATAAAASATSASGSASSASTSATSAASSATAAAASAASIGTQYQEGNLTGTFSGGNTTFPLAHAPLAQAGTIFILGGVPQIMGVDCTLSGTTVTFTGSDQSALTGAAIYRY